MFSISAFVQHPGDVGVVAKIDVNACVKRNYLEDEFLICKFEIYFMVVLFAVSIPDFE